MKATTIAIPVMLAGACVALTACNGAVSTSKAFTFDVSTGGAIQVELDTTSGYDIEPEGGTFLITKDGNPVTKGLFLENDTYDQYAEEAQEYPVFKRNRVRGHNGVYYETTGSDKEYIYMIKLNDSHTAIALSTKTNEDDATAVTSALVFTVNPEK